MTESALIESWVHGRSPLTQANYRRIAEEYLARGASIQATTLADLQAYATSLAGLKPTTQRTKLNSLRSLFRFAHTQGYLPKNPASALIIPKAPWRVGQRLLTEQKVHQLFYGVADVRVRLILRLLYASAFRASEFVKIRAEDVEAREPDERGRARGQVTVHGKGSKHRTVLLVGETWEELAALVVGQGPDFRPFPFSRFQLYRLVRKAAEETGIRLPEGKGKNVSTHWMRHAHVSHAMDRGAPAHLVMRDAGHSSLATTTVYAHAREDDSSSGYLVV